MIHVENLGFAYAGRSAVLHGISLHVSAGERAALLGPNGAGKSTLLLILAGILKAKTGSAAVAGFDLADPMQRRRLPERVGLLFQDSDDQVIGLTVAEDVALGPRNLGCDEAEVARRVEESLARVGLSGQGGGSPRQMSDGQRRRVALAGLLAMRPELLLLDEPTAALDPRGRRELAALLAEISATQLVATHDLEFARKTCGRGLLLDEGRLIADGPIDDLLSDAALMQRHGLEVPWSLGRFI